MQGGTISVTTLLLVGNTISFCGVTPAAWALAPPPGVIKIVLAGGGATADPLLLLLELELLLELDDEPQGSTATLCVKVLRGISIRFEPGGMLLLPD
jgi:hypothetical protein